MVKAITVTKATTIKISYISGQWKTNVSLPTSDANGYTGVVTDLQLPLQEATGVIGGKITNVMALTGAFVPKRLTDDNSFTPTDGTKKTRGVGIMPDKLFFVGNDNVMQTSGAGTLYLGVNDMIVADNSGSLTIEITTP